MIKHLFIIPFLCAVTLLKAQTDTVTAKINKIPHKHLDVLARFPQGDFKNYISANIQANHTFENNINGQIILLMTVGADGMVTHVSVLKSLSPKIDPEVIHVINSSPKWQPAMVNGQRTSMDMVLNIDIAIKGYKQAAESKPVFHDISKPIYASVKPNESRAIKPIAAITKKAPQTIVAKKVEPQVVKKPAPMVAKKAEPPVVKKTAPVIAKKVEPPVVKKPAPIVAKKVEPPVVKKPAPVVAKKVEPPVVKKPAPIVAKKVEPPVVKKPAPIVAKKVEPPVVKKPMPLVAKKTTPPVIKKPADVKEPVVAVQPPPAKKPKRVVLKQNLFNPSSNNAHFPGGDQNFPKFLGENIIYPENAKKAGIQGRVVLSFVVEEDGTVDDVEVLSSPSEDLSQEAIRVMLAMPKWKPAEQNKIKVAVSFTVPINFKLSDKGN